jgi:hypothetical protein
MAWDVHQDLTSTLHKSRDARGNLEGRYLQTEWKIHANSNMLGGGYMKRSALILPVVFLLLAAAGVVHAQDGCVDSPEDPTVVFGLLAAGVTIAFTRFRKH